MSQGTVTWQEVPASKVYPQPPLHPSVLRSLILILFNESEWEENWGNGSPFHPPASCWKLLQWWSKKGIFCSIRKPKSKHLFWLFTFISNQNKSLSSSWPARKPGEQDREDGETLHTSFLLPSSLTQLAPASTDTNRIHKTQLSKNRHMHWLHTTLLIILSVRFLYSFYNDRSFNFWNAIGFTLLYYGKKWIVIPMEHLQSDDECGWSRQSKSSTGLYRNSSEWLVYDISCCVLFITDVERKCLLHFQSMFQN